MVGVELDGVSIDPRWGRDFSVLAKSMDQMNEYTPVFQHPEVLLFGFL